MASQDIRLRLVIRRHCMPDVRLVWPCACSDNFTISRLLEQINEVVPLEGGEWGLEDYAVELSDGKGGSFECLHFQPVGRTLKDEDQVTIRCLLSDDLKRRRLTGRHQIASDGSHLVDGIAFGRTWLRTPRHRPVVELPPRKRARLTHEEIPEEDDTQLQLLLEGPDQPQGHVDGANPEEERSFRPADYLGSSDEDDFEATDAENEEDEDDMDDLALEDEEQVDLEEEVRDLHHENMLLDHQYPTTLENDFEDHLNADRNGYAHYEEDDDDEATLEQNDEEMEAEEEVRFLQEKDELAREKVAAENLSNGPPKMGSFQRFELDKADYVGLPNQDILSLLQDTFPDVPVEVLMDKVQETRGDVARIYLSLSNTTLAQVSFDEFMDSALLGLPQAPPEKFSFENLTNQPPIKPNRPLIQEVEEYEVIEAPKTNGVGISPVKKPTPLTKIHPQKRHEEEDTSSSSSEEDSSSGSSYEEESEAVSYDERARDAAIKLSKQALFAPENESSSESDLEAEGFEGAKLDYSPHDTHDESSDESSDEETSDDSSDDTSDDSDSNSDSDSDSDSDSNSDSDSASDAEPKELISKSFIQTTMPPSSKSNKAASSSSQTQEKKSATSAATETESQPPTAPGAGLSRTQKRNARRRRNKQALHNKSDQKSPLDTLNDEFLARKQALLAAVSLDSEKSLVDTLNEEAPTSNTANANVSKKRSLEQSQEEKTQGAQDGSTQHRNRVDMGAGRRLLFGALGLKAPKTKTDEDKIKQTLMKDVQPLQNPKVTYDVPTTKDLDHDMDSWKDHIIYRAVECCYDNMMLSEPPFPFVQRWDPQQKSDQMRKRKRHSGYYNGESSFVGDDSCCNDTADGETASMRKKKKKNKKKSVRIEEQVNQKANENGEDIAFHYDDSSQWSSQFTDLDDLPSLPSDLTMLPALEPGIAQPGMVITWKQLLMSKATKWQPELVSITGLILPAADEGTLRVLLAKRDREKNEKLYDEETGERVYDKFEVPDLEEEEDEDTGFRSIAWKDLIEPKLLQPAPTTTTDAVDVSMRMNSFVEEERPLEDGQLRAEVSDSRVYEEHMEVELGPTVNEGGAEGKTSQDTLADEVDRFKISFMEVQDPDEVMGGLSSFSGYAPQNEMETESAEAMDGVETTRTGEAPSQDSHNSTREFNRTAADEVADLEGQVTDLDDTKAFDVDGILSKPSFSFAEDEITGPEAARVAYPDLALSSSSQMNQDRQPDFLVDESFQDDTTLIQETLPRLRDRTPISHDGKGAGSPAATRSSPFPSIEEIIMSATSQKQTQKSMQIRTDSPEPTQKKKRSRNVEYEEAMRKLDEGEESDSVPGLFPHSTQPARRIKREPQASSGDSLESAGIYSANPSFVIPSGSQVIVLSSSNPPSPAQDSDEADDDSDDYFARPSKSVLPQGPGWKRKYRTPMEYSSSAPSNHSRAGGSKRRGRRANN